MKERYIEALMDMAERFGKTSYAERLKVGALVYKRDSIIALGCNGQPSGWPTEVCEGTDGKTLDTVRHAEVAALEKLINSTETAEGSVMFVSHAPCKGCAIKIVGAKIKKVYYRHTYRSTAGIEYLLDKGVEVCKID